MTSSAPLKRIFIVEAQQLFAADLAGVLEKVGYVVAGSVRSGEAAALEAPAAEPDLILIGVRLQGPMDGIDAATLIRSKIDLPVVYLLATDADEETISRANEMSPFGYLVAPFNERELRAVIEIALYKHAMDHLLADERARRRAAEEFERRLQSVKDYAIFMLDTKGRITSWNEGAEHITGYDGAAAIGQHMSILYPPDEDTAGEFRAQLQRALRNGRVEHEGWRVRRDGSRFWAEGTIAPVSDEGGVLRGFAVVTRDLTERKYATETRDALVAELRASVLARDDFLQVASHELKTPLTALEMQVAGLKRTLATAGVEDGPIGKKIDALARQTKRLGKIVESLLDVARITSGRVTLRIENFDLVALAKETLERHRGDAQRAGSSIELRAPERLFGYWDRLRVEQVIANLLSNAIKYGAGKHIEIDISAVGKSARVKIRDFGIGMDQAASGRIFERFERAVSSRNYGGLGLGLFIAKHFAQAHGGTISVDSEPDVGSTFTFLVPIDGSKEVARPSDAVVPPSH